MIRSFLDRTCAVLLVACLLQTGLQAGEFQNLAESRLLSVHSGAAAFDSQALEYRPLFQRLLPTSLILILLSNGLWIDLYGQRSQKPKPGGVPAAMVQKDAAQLAKELRQYFIASAYSKNAKKSPTPKELADVQMKITELAFMKGGVEALRVIAGDLQSKQTTLQIKLSLLAPVLDRLNEIFVENNAPRSSALGTAGEMALRVRLFLIDTYYYKNSKNAPTTQELEELKKRVAALVEKEGGIERLMALVIDLNNSAKHYKASLVQPTLLLALRGIAQAPIPDRLTVPPGFFETLVASVKNAAGMATNKHTSLVVPPFNPNQAIPAKEEPPFKSDQKEYYDAYYRTLYSVAIPGKYAAFVPAEVAKNITGLRGEFAGAKSLFTGNVLFAIEWATGRISGVLKEASIEAAGASPGTTMSSENIQMLALRFRNARGVAEEQAKVNLIIGQLSKNNEAVAAMEGKLKDPDVFAAAALLLTQLPQYQDSAKMKPLLSEIVKQRYSQNLSPSSRQNSDLLNYTLDLIVVRSSRSDIEAYGSVLAAAAEGKNGFESTLQSRALVGMLTHLDANQVVPGIGGPLVRYLASNFNNTDPSFTEVATIVARRPTITLPRELKSKLRDAVARFIKENQFKIKNILKLPVVAQMLDLLREYERWKDIKSNPETAALKAAA